MQDKATANDEIHRGTHRFVRTATAVGIAVSVLGACGGGGDNPDNAAASTATVDPQVANQAAAIDGTNLTEPERNALVMRAAKDAVALKVPYDWATAPFPAQGFQGKLRPSAEVCPGGGTYLVQTQDNQLVEPGDFLLPVISSSAPEAPERRSL